MTLTSLVSGKDAEVARREGLTVVWMTEDGKGSLSRPILFGRRRAVAVDTKAVVDFHREMVLLDKKQEKEYKIDVHSRLRISPSEKTIVKVAERAALPGGVDETLSRDLRDFIENWEQENSTALKTLVASPENVKAALRAKLVEWGVEASTLSIDAVPWQEGSVSLDEKSPIRILTSDASYIDVELHGLLDVDPRVRDKFLTCNISPTTTVGGHKSIRDLSFDALFAAADNKFTLEEWVEKDGISSIKEKLRSALDEKVTQYGRHVVRFELTLAVPWQDARVSLDEIQSLRVLTSDSGHIDVELRGLIDLDPLRRPEFVRSAALSSGASTAVDRAKTAARSSIVETLDGRYRLQQWIDGGLKIEDEVRDALNAKMQSHGRCVVALQLHPKVELSQSAELNFDQTFRYPITGVSRQLCIQHRGSYRLTNAGRFERCKARDPEASDFVKLIGSTIRKATERFLQPLQYGQAISLLVEKSWCDALQTKVQTSLVEICDLYGFEAKQFVAIVQSLPEVALLRGTEVRDDPVEYGLSLPRFTAQLGFIAYVKLHPDKADSVIPLLAMPAPEIEATSSVRDDRLESAVRMQIRRSISAFVGALQPDQYWLSDLASDEHVNGTPRSGFKSRKEGLLDSIHKDLLDNYGIEVDVKRFVLRRGADPMSDRLFALLSTHRELLVNGNVVSGNTGQLESVTLHCRYRVVGVAADQLKIFQEKAVLHSSAEAHLTEIEAAIDNALRQLMAYCQFEYFSPRVFAARMVRYTSALLELLVQQEYGLEIVIDPTGIWSDTRNLEVNDSTSVINEQLERVKKEFAQLIIPKDWDDIEEHNQKVESALKQINYYEGLIRQMRKESVHRILNGTEIDTLLLQENVPVIAEKLIRSPKLLANLRAQEITLREDAVSNISDEMGIIQSQNLSGPQVSPKD